MKDLIYYPSLSAGGCSDYFKKNKEVKPGLTSRFYSEEFPEEWRHPYFLVTAGHHYKWPDTRTMYGLEKSVTVLGDSGGFQLATGAIKWDPKFKETIFNWLENNTDLAVNLDIPPRAKYDGKFYECLDISYDNFKYFAENQTGKTKFLNVIQGNNLEEYEHWYLKVKDFDFAGWCLGGAQKRLTMLMSAIAPMLKHKEFDKPRNEYVHVLGISKISDFFILAFIQKMFNKYHGGRIQVSTDSSSPGLYPVYGTYLHTPQFRNMTFVDLYFPKGEDLPYNASDPVPNPYGHPVSEGFTFGDVSTYKGDVTTRMTLNNLIVYQKTCEQINELMKCHTELLKTVVPSDMYNVLCSIEEMFTSDDPVLVFEKYRQMYNKFGGDTRSLPNNNVFNQFFEM
jgi:hypothetical protein